MSVFWNEYKAKRFGRVNRLFVLVYSKRFKTRIFNLPKGIIKNYNIIINRKNFTEQAIDAAIKQYEEIRKLIAGEN